MGLTQKLGTIPLAISTDASNNVGIGGSPSGSYKLEVTGTAKVSSTLLVSGALTGTNASFVGTGDFSSGALTLTLGADNGLTTRTNATQKIAKIVSYNYTNANNPVGMMVANNDGTDNALWIGGGSGATIAATNIQFFTAANNNTATGTARMTIGSTGKVGISTSVAADVLLNVVNSSSTGFGMNISAGSSSSNYALRVENYNGASSLLYVRGDGNVGIGTSSPQAISGYGGLTLNGTDGSFSYYRVNGTNVGRFLGDGANFYMDNLSTTGSLIFTVNNTSIQAMRITSAGNVGIGVIPSAWSTANSVKALQNYAGSFWNYNDSNLYVGLNNYWDGSNRRYINNGLASEYQQNGDHIFFTAPTGTAGNVVTLTERMRIKAGGYIDLNSVVYNDTMSSPRTLYIQSNGSIGGISSIKASKKNIQNVSNIDWLYQLTPVTFNYRKKDENRNYTEEIYDEITYGLIAEDTQPIAEFLINYDDSNSDKKMIGIEYMKLITPMLKAIQELSAQNQDLKSRLDKAGL